MNLKEYIKHIKSICKQGILRHKNIILDETFQKELLEIIKCYEQLEQDNQELKEQLEELEEENFKLRENVYIEKTSFSSNGRNIKELIEMPNYEEIQKENQSLKKQLEEKDILIKQCELSVSNVMDCYCERTDCSGRIKDSKQYDSLVQKVENQQKEFIYYLERTIEELECDDVDDEEMKGYLIQRIYTFKEILSKYKEIQRGKDEV